MKLKSFANDLSLTDHFVVYQMSNNHMTNEPNIHNFEVFMSSLYFPVNIEAHISETLRIAMTKMWISEIKQQKLEKSFLLSLKKWKQDLLSTQYCFLFVVLLSAYFSFEAAFVVKNNCFVFIVESCFGKLVGVALQLALIYLATKDQISFCFDLL